MPISFTVAAGMFFQIVDCYHCHCSLFQLKVLVRYQYFTCKLDKVLYYLDTAGFIVYHIHTFVIHIAVSIFVKRFKF